MGLDRKKFKTRDGRLTAGEMICYGLGDCGANVVCTLLGTFLTAYYTDTAGIAAAAVATMMLISRFTDGISDLIMGVIVDKTHSKYGKARPWILWSAPVMALALILLFSVPDSFSNSGKLVYAYITYIFMNTIAYTMNNLPYNALLSRMTLNIHDRTAAASVRFVMIDVLIIFLTAMTTALSNTLGWMKLCILYAFIMIVLMLFCFLGCHEHIDEDETGNVVTQKIPLKEGLKSLLKNKYFFIQAVMFIVLYTSQISLNSMGLYYCNIVLGKAEFITIITACSLAPDIVMNFILPKLVDRFGKRKLWIAGTAVMCAGSLMVGFAFTNVYLLVLGLILKGIGRGPIMSGMFAMTADVVDYGEWKTGIRCEGLINSCTSFGMKVGIGLGSAATGWILAMGNYDLNPTASASVLAIRFGFGYFHAILAAVLVILCIAMNVDKHMEQIHKELSVKHNV